jgi:hypothetical protein
LLPALTHPHRLAAIIREQFLGPAPASSSAPAEARK